ARKAVEHGFGRVGNRVQEQDLRAHLVDGDESTGIRCAHAFGVLLSRLAMVASATATSFSSPSMRQCTFASTTVSERPGLTTSARQVRRSPRDGASRLSLYSAVITLRVARSIMVPAAAVVALSTR